MPGPAVRVPNGIVDEAIYTEPLLPPVITLIIATLIPSLLPDALLPGPRWLFPVVIFALMTAMLVLDPGRIDRRSRLLRRVRVVIALAIAACSTHVPVVVAHPSVICSGASVHSL